MNESSKFHSLITLTALAVWLSLFAPSGFSQELSDTSLNQEEGVQKVRVEGLHIGAHPDLTRIEVTLDQPTGYEVIPDFKNKKISLYIKNAIKDPRVRPLVFRDRYLERVDITSLESTIKLTFRLQNQNTRLFHFFQNEPARVILDFQGKKGKVTRAKIKSKASKKEKATTSKSESRPSPDKLKRLVAEDRESKLENGWDDYKSALTTFQKKNYEDAVKAFKKFRKDFPESKYLEHILYLEAEATFNINNVQAIPIYEDVLNAYRLAMRTYPESHFYDHALLKLAQIFDNMDLTLEAKTLYLDGVKRDRKSLYNASREVGLAEMMLREEKYGEAYKSFQRILQNDPKNPEARKAIFKIAQWHFEQNDFDMALKIYEDGARRWPAELKDVPEINYYMGEIYFRNKDYAKARSHLFTLINLAPDSATSHKSLNRIGDSYLLENNGLAALSTFDKSSKMNPGSAQGQYALIRLADIGVRDPTLPVRDVIFDYPAYFKPMETYETVRKDAQSNDILAEVALSRGTAFFNQRRYLEAIQELRKLVPMGKESRFYKTARNFIRQAIVKVIDDYSNQQGYLPILYAYTDFKSLGLGDIETLSSLLQIGESYQAIGMQAEALRFYEKVKLQDINGVYRDRLFLNLGRIQLDNNKFKEAEVVALTFLNNYPISPHVPESLKVLAGAYKGQKKYDEAHATYKRLLAHRDADIAETHYLIAETWFEQNRLQEAIREYLLTVDTFDRRIRNVPQYVSNAYYRIGISFHAEEQFKQALEALNAARELFPDHSLRSWADYLIADCHERMKDQGQAVETLRTMIQTGDESDLVRQAAESRLKVLDWEKRFKELL